MARIVDVSLGTLRTVALIQGQRTACFVLGFFEVLVWILVVQKVVSSLGTPIYAVAYAFGFAAGNVVGLTVEKWVARGLRAIQIFTREGANVVEALRNAGFEATMFEGSGRQGPISFVFVQTSRRRAPLVTALVEEIDPNCFYLQDDVELASSVLLRRQHKVRK